MIAFLSVFDCLQGDCSAGTWLFVLRAIDHQCPGKGYFTWLVNRYFLVGSFENHLSMKASLQLKNNGKRTQIKKRFSNFILMVDVIIDFLFDFFLVRFHSFNFQCHSHLVVFSLHGVLGKYDRGTHLQKLFPFKEIFTFMFGFSRIFLPTAYIYSLYIPSFLRSGCRDFRFLNAFCRIRQFSFFL